MGETYQKLEETDQFKSFWKKAEMNLKYEETNKNFEVLQQIEISSFLKKTEMDQKYDLKKIGF